MDNSVVDLVLHGRGGHGVRFSSTWPNTSSQLTPQAGPSTCNMLALLRAQLQVELFSTRDPAGHSTRLVEQVNPMS